MCRRHPDKKSRTIVLKHSARWERANKRVTLYLSTPGNRPLGMEHFVDLRNQHVSLGRIRMVASHPSCLEFRIPGLSAVVARTMSCCECRCLVEKEEFGVRTFGKYRSMNFVELECAGNPGLPRPQPNNRRDPLCSMPRLPMSDPRMGTDFS